ncbi:MAG: hypothetical protein V4465_03305 [Patescibacteria group bacterium]
MPDDWNPSDYQGKTREQVEGDYKNGELAGIAFVILMGGLALWLFLKPVMLDLWHALTAS